MLMRGAIPASWWVALTATILAVPVLADAAGPHERTGPAQARPDQAPADTSASQTSLDAGDTKVEGAFVPPVKRVRPVTPPETPQPAVPPLPVRKPASP